MRGLLAEDPLSIAWAPLCLPTTERMRTRARRGASERERHLPVGVDARQRERGAVSARTEPRRKANDNGRLAATERNQENPRDVFSRRGLALLLVDALEIFPATLAVSARAVAFAHEAAFARPSHFDELAVRVDHA